MTRPLFLVAPVLVLSAMIMLAAPCAAAPVDWPSYNRTLTSERYAPLAQIDAGNIAGLKIVCIYDTKLQIGFQTGLVQRDGALIFTTDLDTISIDPNTCAENWRTHEDIPNSALKVNRGVAVMDGRVFRGASTGQIFAYDEKTGKRLWATTIANPAIGESVPAAPIAWNGLVFIGNAGGDAKGVKGRLYALDAASGKIVWEFYLVPRAPSDVPRGPEADNGQSRAAASWINAKGFPISGGATWTSYTLDPSTGLLYVPGGNPAPDFVNAYRHGANLYTGAVVAIDAKSGAYKRHFEISRRDFHDWDVSTAPVVFTARSGRRVMAVAPKDGYLHGFDLGTGRELYRKPMTTIFNPTAPLTPAGTRFCPGVQGGAEWNGPAYDPDQGTLLTGEVDWCTTVRTASKQGVEDVKFGQSWSGASDDGFGTMDKPPQWAGWLTASDAETGATRWRFKAPTPLIGGVTPTAGGIVLFGDMSGEFYALSSATGKKLWSMRLDGGVGGGVITYDTGAGQKIAIADGLTSPIWPAPKVTGRVVVLGLK